MTEFLRVHEAAAEMDKPVSFIRLKINNGELPAKKQGREYLIKRTDFNTFLGISNDVEELKKDAYIKELENEIQAYKLQNMTLKNLLQTMNNVIGVDKLESI